MKLLDHLERRIRRYAIRNLTGILLIGQAMAMFAAMVQPEMHEKLVLIPSKVLAGEVWRLLTFIIAFPPPNDALGFFLVFFYFMIFWMMGNALDSTWGTARYNIYIFIGLVLTAAAAWVAPDNPTASTYVYTSIFLAFAYLYPNFEFLLFFFLPVKVKWLALLTWLFYVVTLVGGDMATRCMVLAGVCNFGLFFGPEIFRRVVRGHKRRAREAEAAEEAAQPFHVCSMCGATDRTDPNLHFRYLPTVDGTQCVCETCLEKNK